MKHAEPPQVGEVQRLLERIAALERERDELKFGMVEANIAWVNMKHERDEARELLREIAACSDEHCGLNYVTKQMPKSLLSRIGDALKARKGGE